MVPVSTQGTSLSSSSSSTPWRSFRKFFVQLVFVVWQWMGVWLLRNNEELERGKSISLELIKEKEESRSSQGVSELSPSSSSTPQWKYEVFLSFRGMDTRRGFADHLYTALQQNGIWTFRDDEKLERGKLISPELLKAIEGSRFAIVIFSKNYASSTWCLDELVHIVRCKKETGLTILPIFYDVNPCDVRKQMETFGHAFNQHEKHFKKDIKKVGMWRVALREVSNISGWHLQDWHESEFIQHIVKEMTDKLSSKSSSNTKNFVGIESIVAKLIPSYLGFENNVYMIGIYGMGGLGKTTLARVFYDKFHSHFEGSSFIANVKEYSEKHGLPQLQQQLLIDILEDKNIYIENVYKGVEMIKRRLCRKKVLLVIDDVNQLDQLEKLVGEKNWFGLGSWIIITTRDKHLLVQHGVVKRYKPEVLNNDDALKLFCSKAFKMEQPKEGYMQLSLKVVEYAKGLPLALVTLGSFLVGRTIDEWQSALDSFKKTKGEIFDILKISYDGLEDMWKGIFLDIACYFRGREKDQVIQMLENCDVDARIGISVLVEKSLLTIDDNEHLGMHDLLTEMGEKIIRLESGGNLGKQSRLWLMEDLHHVLENNMPVEEIRAIATYGKENFNFEEFPEGLSKMSNLRLLMITKPQISNALNHVPNNVRNLSWSNYFFKCLPSSFQPKELVQLDLAFSSFEYLWEGVKHLGKLKFIDVSNSENLIRTPDFSGVPILERLQLFGCSSLVEIHPSIGQLSKLSYLDLRGCQSLTSLPNMSAKMESLTVLHLGNCSKLEKIPQFKGIMKNLSKLYLCYTAIKELSPSSIECLTALTLLDLEHCKNLECLPSNMDSLRSLQELVLSRCSKLAKLPESLWKIKSLKELQLRGMSRLEEIRLNGIGCLSSLTYLTLSSNNFVTLPASISQLSKLEVLDLSYCNQLQALPELPSTTRYINANNCLHLKPSPGLHLEPATWLYYNESSGGWAFKILNRYLQGLLCPKTGYEISTKREKNGSINEFQIFIPGYEIPPWLTHQSLGNTVSIDLPPNWCNSRWMGFALCASFYDLYSMSHISRIRARVIALGDIPQSLYSTNIFFRPSEFCRRHIWILYLSCDDWFATIGNGQCSQIEVVFETSDPKGKWLVRQCGVSLVYKPDKEEFGQGIAQCSNSHVIAFAGWDGVHHGFKNSTRSCDDYSDSPSSSNGTEKQSQTGTVQEAGRAVASDQGGRVHQNRSEQGGRVYQGTGR